MGQHPKPLPDVDDPLMAPYWAAAKQHRLVVQQCDGCGVRRWPPRPVCPECQWRGGAWVDVLPVGTVWSHVVYHRAFHRGFEDELPYTVLLVELEGGLRVEGALAAPSAAVTEGDRVEAAFDDVTPEVTLVRWAKPEA